ncbi:uncharacterized protein [Ptychodera flava]|uniref:uncharacterized protein n=1 Tax=Ptychodera flava TaxID=63121 RepID=UPI003969D02D
MAALNQTFRSEIPRFGRCSCRRCRDDSSSDESASEASEHSGFLLFDESSSSSSSEGETRPRNTVDKMVTISAASGGSNVNTKESVDNNNKNKHSVSSSEYRLGKREHKSNHVDADVEKLVKRLYRVKEYVPANCSSAVHNSYYRLRHHEGFQDFDTSPGARQTSSRNIDTIKKLVADVIYWNKEGNWSTEVIVDGCLKYLKTKQMYAAMERRGKLEEHRQRIKQRSRRDRKRKRRCTALKDIGWSPTRKQRVEKVMSDIIYHSSEESCDGKDDNGRFKRIRKTLPWETTELKLCKEELDGHYKKYASSFSVSQLRTIVDSGRFSKRGMPLDAPRWTYSVDTYMANLYPKLW